jgi:uncharacterized protein YceK
MPKLVLVILITLSGCGSPKTNTVGGATQSEAQALNDAATMLDNNAAEPVVANENAPKP